MEIRDNAPSYDRLFDRLAGIPVAIAYLDAKHAPRETFIFKKGQPGEKRMHVFTSDNHDGWYPAPKNPGREYTDDYLLTIATMRALTESNGYDAPCIIKHFLQAKEDYPYGFGLTIKTVLEKTKTGTPAVQASKEYWKKNPEKSSNGSLMRCAPIAMLDYNKHNTLVAHTIDASTLTHYHPNAVQACVFHNSMIATLLYGETKHDSYKKASQTLTHSMPEIKQLYQEPTGRTSSHQRPVQRIQIKPESPPNQTVSGDVLDTLNTALFIFLNTKTFKQADAVLGALEGDVDTVGAVLGGLCGACYGYASLPDEKKEILDWNGRPIHDETIDLTRKIHALSQEIKS